MLISNSILTFGKPKSFASIEHQYPKGKHKTKSHKFDWERGGGLKEVKISTTQVRELIALGLLAIGFLLQIISLW